MLTILVGLLLIAYIVFATRFILRFPGTTTVKTWLGIGSILALIGWFVILTLSYAKIDLAFRSKLRLYALTRSANPSLQQGGPALLTMDARERNGQLELLRLGQRAPYVTVFYPNRLRFAQLEGDAIRFTGSEDTRVGGLYWVYTNTTTYTSVKEIN